MVRCTPACSDHISRFADTCRIYEPEQDTMDVYLFFDGISRGACYLTDDGPVFIEQGIQQRGLTRIGSAGNDRLHTLFDDMPRRKLSIS